MDSQSKYFLRTWLLTAAIALAAVGAFDLLVDPYMLFERPRIPGFNARKPVVDFQERWMKTYDVLHVHPKTVILGSSRVDIGVAAGDDAWPERLRPVYNLGISGGSPYVAYRYLQHVMSGSQLELVVLGLDLEYFVKVKAAERPPDQEFESRFVIADDGAQNATYGSQRVRDFLQATLSLDALMNSAETVAGNIRKSSSDFKQGNWEFGLYLSMPSYPLIANSDLFSLRYYQDKRPNELRMDELRDILELCKARHTRLILFINPMQADLLEILDLVGQWQTFETWKRQLVALVAKYVDLEHDNEIVLWDFSGYDRYSTEPVPQYPSTLQWFWDTSHYRPALGHLIISRILGQGARDFGIVLDPENLDEHLADIRRQQMQYRGGRRSAVRRVRDLYQRAEIHPSYATAPIN